MIRRLEERDLASLRAAQADLAREGFPFAFDFEPDDPGFDFATYVATQRANERGEALRDGLVANTFLVAVDGDEIVGRVSVRHELNEFLAHWGGHIGYAVTSSHRGRGIAHRLLAAGLDRLREVGVERALVTCDHDNVVSAAVIEKAGGEFESEIDDPSDGVRKRRYWIDLT